MEKIETTLFTNLFTHAEDGGLIVNENFTKLSRKSAIYELTNDLDYLTKQELDLVDDYKETIAYLEILNDQEYESVKQSMLSTGTLPE